MRFSLRSGLAISVLLAVLVMVRLFQDKLFYDPLIPFFKTENKKLPEFDNMRLFLSLAFRYALNTIFSLGIIWLVFKERRIIKLTTILYVVFFMVLVAVLFLCLGSDKPNLLLVFYVRRFLIQPLFLLLFLPAFYYQKRTTDATSNPSGN